MPCPPELIALAHAMAEPGLDAAILAEGNVSCRGDEATLWVKASGHGMGAIGPEGFVEVEIEPVVAALDRSVRDEAAVRELLNMARVDPTLPAVPSTETFMHAWLLGLGDVNYVAHTHPTPLISLLALQDGESLARRRLFPDEIVLCGAASAWVPYVAPGLPLAIEVRSSVLRFHEHFGMLPKTIWLQNHGLIALGRSSKEVESATRMAVKAARASLGALHTGKPVRWLSEEEIQQIANWPDEHFRQRLLWEV